MLKGSLDVGSFCQLENEGRTKFKRVIHGGKTWFIQFINWA